MDPNYIRGLHPLDLDPERVADEIERLQDALASIQRIVSYPVDTSIDTRGYALRGCSEGILGAVFEKTKILKET